MDIFIAYMENLKTIMLFVYPVYLMALGIIYVLSNPKWTGDKDQVYSETYANHQAFMRVLKFLPVVILLGCTPSFDKIWKVRLALIKLELSSSENVQKNLAEIHVIAEKLECKYIGCAAQTERKK